MPVTATQHADILDFKVERIYRGQTARICLSNTALTVNSTPEEVFASELLPQNGYARISQAIATDAGIYNSSTEELTLPILNATFTASGAALEWRSCFVLIGGSATASKSFTAASVDPAADRITLAAHGLANGDRILFTPEATSMLPGGIASSVRYYVEAVDLNTIRLHANLALSSLVDITNTGSGTMYLRYASGRIAAVVQEDAPVQRLDGQQYTYSINLKEAI